MNKIIKLSFIVFIVLNYGLCKAQNKQNYFMSDPVLSPDAKEIVFAYDSDLWRVSASGGTAYRITALNGIESKPLISPDGQWLAFNSNQFGNNDIFIMPYNGGEIIQLTYHEANDVLETWSWDSQTIYFFSNRENSFSTYNISLNGGTPKRLFNHYFATVHDVAIHPKTGELFFNETWESNRFANRKRYKGAYNPDIQSYNFKTKQLKKYTDYIGKDFGTTIDRQGNIYFMSDESNGEYNLYTFKNDKKKALTNFKTSIYFPKVSANGQKIVFRKDYQIYLYDVATGITVVPPIKVSSQSILEKNQSYKINEKISAFDVSPNEKLIAFVSRGRLFISDIKGKFVKELPTKSIEAVDEVRWLNDNKTLIYSQTVKGYHNWFTQEVGKNGSETQRTFDKHRNRQIDFNSDKTKAVFYSGRNDLKLMDLKSFQVETIAKDEFWSFRGSAPKFSPDDRFILYASYENFEQDIWVYDLDSKKTVNISNSLISESDPVWSPDGKYIYFSSDRQHPSFPFGTQENHIYRVALQKIDQPFKVEKLNEIFEEFDKDKKEEQEDEIVENETDEKEETPTDDEKGDVKEKEIKDSTKVEVKIDFETDLMDHIELVGPHFGEQQAPFIVQKDDKTRVIYLSNHQGGKYQLWETSFEDFEEPKTQVLIAKPLNGNIDIKHIKKSIYILLGGKIGTLGFGKMAFNEIKIDYSFEKNLSQEFEQMFYETWATVEQNFYDETFHGENWEACKQQYEKFLPFVNNRNDLRQLINDMLGELNTSHYGFYSKGDEEKTQFNVHTLETGIQFDQENPYKVNRIISNSPVDLARVNLSKGSVLKEVNGQSIDKNVNRNKYFTSSSSNSEIQLKFDDHGKTLELDIHPVSYRNISSLLYDEWEQQNEIYVDEKAKKSISYVHMKDMSQSSYNDFMKQMVSQDGNRKGLIVDLRYNTGGNVHDKVLKFLSQRPYLQWKYREGEKGSQPNFTPSAYPIVMLINEQSLSDAEMTSAGFKALKLGTLVGTETYRWIIFTTAGLLVDGSIFRLPSWGCYTLDGKDLEQEGVKPDIFVEENFIDRLQNNQPQLDKAIEIIKQERK